MKEQVELNNVINELLELLVTIDASKDQAAAKLAMQFIERLDMAMFACKSALKDRLQEVCPHDWRGSVKDKVIAQCKICRLLDLTGDRRSPGDCRLTAETFIRRPRTIRRPEVGSHIGGD